MNHRPNHDPLRRMRFACEIVFAIAILLMLIAVLSK